MVSRTVPAGACLRLSYVPSEGRYDFLGWFGTYEGLYIAGIEVGARNPSVKALERLATALSVRLSELFDRLP